MQGNPGNFCFWNLESQDILLVEIKSGILSFGIQKYKAQGIWNPTNNWNPWPETKFH